ncbi:hypothetical protein Pla144_05680 [Bythopirellula polymerisocia]|uniref:Uncharacterized protein n=1 Tax=Bythopirellula polymerisocia TaxID=2528003 RepID=A0A5C6D4K6_9BACT|nr:hypothetical protein Pla144_05680 [Bythopirellula polymerisocia]
MYPIAIDVGESAHLGEMSKEQFPMTNDFLTGWPLDPFGHCSWCIENVLQRHFLTCRVQPNGFELEIVVCLDMSNGSVAGTH